MSPDASFECRAILFDLDGVLVDSTPVVEGIWRRWAAEKGLDVDLILEVAHGRRTVETIRHIAPDLDADSEAAGLERIERSDFDGIREIAGASALLSSLPDGTWTVVTSGTRPLAEGRMRHIGLPLPERFITANDVENGKPHPEPYLRGAEILGVAPEECLVIEDAPSGMEAAKAAGMRVLAVATTFDADQLSAADVVAGSLKDIRVEYYTAERGYRLDIRVKS